MTLSAAVAPAAVLTLTEETADSADEVLSPTSEAVDCKAKLWFDCNVTTPCTVAAVWVALIVVDAVPPAASALVPEKLAIETLSPVALVRTSWFDELTVAVVPVVPVFWLIAFTRPERPA